MTTAVLQQTKQQIKPQCLGAHSALGDRKQLTLYDKES